MTKKIINNYYQLNLLLLIILSIPNFKSKIKNLETFNFNCSSRFKILFQFHLTFKSQNFIKKKKTIDDYPQDTKSSSQLYFGRMRIIQAQLE